MKFKLPKFTEPDFSKDMFKDAPNASYSIVKTEGTAPENYHATSIFPEYFKIHGEWVLANKSRMDCVAVINSENKIDVKELRTLENGDKVIVGRSEDGSEGVYLHTASFSNIEDEGEAFSFRAGRTRETAYSKDYDNLYDLLKHEKDNGYVVWVLGPAVVFDSNARKAFSTLIDNGYVDVLMGGNAVATHDLEGAIYRTALGQDIYTQESKKNGHYHHLDTINRVRNCGSIENFIKEYKINDGIIHSCYKNNVPVVLAGSIRDDGPLPEVISDVYKAQNTMREHIKKATTVLCLATQLHSIAVGNMTPSYQCVDSKVRPVYLYSIDISEFAVNKLRDRGSLEVKTIVTNVQDFVVKLAKNT